MLVIKQFGPVTYAIGTLQEILAATNIAVGSRALPNDVAGCTLEMGADGLWTGVSVGALTQVQADALVASGALATVKVGTPGNVAGTLVRYDGVGWSSAQSCRKIISPYLQQYERGTVPFAYGFVERFKAPANSVGFDVAWFSGANAGVLVKATWGTAPALTGSSQQGSPTPLQINAVDIASATIPAGANTLPVKVLLSDFVNRKISAGDIIEIRSNTSGDGRGYNNPARGSDSYLYGGGDLYATETTGTIGNTGDVITNNPAVNANVGTTVGCCFIRWYSDAGKLSVLECGDSITKGEAGFAGQVSQGNISPLHLAASINTMISPMVFGHGGNPSVNFHANAIALIPTLMPSVVVIPSWSPNDSAGNIDISINRAMRVCSIAIENGVVPVLKTPNPWSYTGANLIAWQGGVARVRAICAENPKIGMIDIAAALADPTNPGAMKSEYFGTAVDGQQLHPNPAGKWVEAKEYAATIAQYA